MRKQTQTQHGQYDALLTEVRERAAAQGTNVSRVTLMQALMAAKRFGLREAKEIVDEYCARQAPHLL